jgi:hypothetical protein
MALRWCSEPSFISKIGIGHRGGRLLAPRREDKSGGLPRRQQRPEQGLRFRFRGEIDAHDYGCVTKFLLIETLNGKRCLQSHERTTSANTSIQRFEPFSILKLQTTDMARSSESAQIIQRIRAARNSASISIDRPTRFAHQMLRMTFYDVIRNGANASKAHAFVEPLSSTVE